MERQELERERQHLLQVQKVIDARLEKAARDRDQRDQAILEIQRERLEGNRMEGGGRYSVQGFADMLEMSQDTQAIAQAATARDQSSQAIATLLRMRQSPYFARIDFRFDDGETEEIYIGRATLMEEGSMQIYVHDWRAPIAGVFYQHGVGPASYQAPGGVIKGEVTLKRQYEIRDGELMYFFDTDEQVQDAFLRELLSKPSSPAMKGIVETIQRDQDRIIRDMKADVMMVQGAAGSGKTSVALHRVAYLMYQGLSKARLAPEDILILAPNAAFERYISKVLPGLGEKQVQTMLLEELLSKLLPGAAIQPRSEWAEEMLTAGGAGEKAALRHLRKAKGSKAFAVLLDRLVAELPKKWIPFCDVQYDGKTVLSAQAMKASICNAKGKAPLGSRLRMLENTIFDGVHALHRGRLEKLLDYVRRYPHHALEAVPYARSLSILESGRLLAKVRAFTSIDCAALYRRLFADRARFARLAAGLFPIKEAEELRQNTLARLCGDLLPYEDAVAVAYLQARVSGFGAFGHMRQVVADEAQDLNFLHAALLGLLFPGARFTLLGDMHQTLSGSPDESLYDGLRDALHKPESLLVKLDKSFRCTREIWAFAKQFLPPGAAGECFSRLGEEPAVLYAADDAALELLLMQNARQCRESGHSVALLCKTEQDAYGLYERLKGQPDVALVGREDAIREGRICILPLYMAKGLEFDAVLLWGVDEARYRDEGDKNLLYIGCTRALHVLRLFYTGQKSPLLRAGEVGGL